MHITSSFKPARDQLLWCLAISMILGLAAMARADGPIFPKGTRTLQSYGTYASSLDDRGVNLASGNLGASYFVWDNVSLGLEGAGYREQVSGHTGWAYGVNGVLRQHVFQYGKSTVFIDVSFGPIESDWRIPRGGTYFNFATRCGVGITYPLTDRMRLMTGVRYFHVSNAELEGSGRNPSVNGIEGVMGVMWTFYMSVAQASSASSL